MNECKDYTLKIHKSIETTNVLLKSKMKPKLIRSVIYHTRSTRRLCTLQTKVIGKIWSSKTLALIKLARVLNFFFGTSGSGGTTRKSFVCNSSSLGQLDRKFTRYSWHWKNTVFKWRILRFGKSTGWERSFTVILFNLVIHLRIPWGNLMSMLYTEIFNPSLHCKVNKSINIVLVACRRRVAFETKGKDW
jgi:hypothetical protein